MGKLNIEILNLAHVLMIASFRYSKDDDLDDIEKDLGDEYGWKQVRNRLELEYFVTQSFLHYFPPLSKVPTTPNCSDITPSSLYQIPQIASIS